MTDPIDMIRQDISKALQGLVEKHGRTMIKLKDAYMEDGPAEMKITVTADSMDFNRTFSVAFSVDPIESDNEDLALFDILTHWMPLPLPPQAPSQIEEERSDDA